MPTLTLDTTGLHKEEVMRVRAVWQTARRNREIRTRYSVLQPEVGSLRAIAILSEEHHRSERQIRRIIYG